MEDPKVKELAETLKKSGLAVSDYEATQKAQAILGTSISNEDTRKAPMHGAAQHPAQAPEKAPIGKREEHHEEGFLSHLKDKLHHEKQTEVKRTFPQAAHEAVPQNKHEEKEGFFAHLKEKFHHEKNPEPGHQDKNMTDMDPEQKEPGRFTHPDYDVSREDLTVNDLMKEVGVDPSGIDDDEDKVEDVEEKIYLLKEEIAEEARNPDKRNVEGIKRKMEELREMVEGIEKERSEEKSPSE